MIRSGQVPKHSGITNFFSRIVKEQGIWRGNFPNIIRFYPAQCYNIVLKDKFKDLLPRFSPGSDFNFLRGSECSCGRNCRLISMSLVYPLEYAQTRLATDVGNKTNTSRSFTGTYNRLYSQDN